MNDFLQRNDPMVFICFYHIFLSLCFLGPAVKKSKEINEVKILALNATPSPLFTDVFFYCGSLHFLPLSQLGYHAVRCTHSPLTPLTSRCQPSLPAP